MKSASTAAVQNQILNDILSARTRTKPVCAIDYLDDAGVWQSLPYVTSVSVQTDAMKSTFGDVAYIPPASNFSAELVNLLEIYTPESGNELDGVLVNDRAIRVQMGYDLEDSYGHLLTEASDTLTTEDGFRLLTETAELIDMGIFYIEDPNIKGSNGSNSISITGRDAFKRAIETKISLPTYTATDISQIMREALALAGITTSSALIPNVGSTVTVSDVSMFTNKACSEILNAAMSWLNAIVGDYRLFINSDGNAELKAIPTDYTAFDYEMNYFSHLISSSYTYRKNQNVQRCDVFRKDHSTSGASTLGTATRTSAGSFTISWANPAVFVSLAVAFNDSGSDVDLTVDQVNQTSVVFTIIGSGKVNVGITVTGCELAATPPYVGSAISWGLHRYKNGVTQKLINGFVQSDAQARTIAQKVVRDYGVFNPMIADFEVPCNPLLEPNDRIMVTDYNATKKNLFAVESISHSYSASGAQMTSNVRMRYSGVSVVVQSGYLLSEASENLVTENSDKMRIE